MVTTDPKTPVDLSPIVISEIVVEGRRLVATPPLRFDVVFEPDDDEPLFTIEGEFDIIEYATSREMLIDVLYDTLEIMWRDFVGADPAKISPRAHELGVALNRRFGDVVGAA